jgi:hypothetical protein
VSDDRQRCVPFQQSWKALLWYSEFWPRKAAHSSLLVCGASLLYYAVLCQASTVECGISSSSGETQATDTPII